MTDHISRILEELEALIPLGEIDHDTLTEAILEAGLSLIETEAFLSVGSGAIESQYINSSGESLYLVVADEKRLVLCHEDDDYQRREVRIKDGELGAMPIMSDVEVVDGIVLAGDEIAWLRGVVAAWMRKQIEPLRVV